MLNEGQALRVRVRPGLIIEFTLEERLPSGYRYGVQRAVTPEEINLFSAGPARALEILEEHLQEKIESYRV